MSRPRPGVISWMTRHGVSANLLMLVLLVGGFLASLQIKKEVFPEFSLDMVAVSVGYPGASPEDVEQGIVLVVEEALQGIDGVEEITSIASEGMAQINAELSADADPSTVFQDIQQAVSRINTFPADAEQPNVALAKRVRDVLNILIYGDTSEVVLHELAESVRDQLLSTEGVTQVELQGSRDYRIHIDVPSARLQAHGLTLRQVADKLSSSAVDASGGSVETRAGEILVRVDERRDLAREFADLPVISAADGTVVRLGEIATVRESFDETQDVSASFDGQPAIGLQVFRIGEQTPIGVSTAAREALEQIRSALPAGIDVVVLNDQSEIYQQRLDLLMKNAFIGLVLVFALMALFLEFKLAFWVTMGIPISFLGAMLFLPGMGASINMISMFAFIISLGIVVDDAVVVGENVYEYRQQGMSFLEAAIEGARDVAVPVTFSVLTNLIAFLPLLFVPGFLGKIWGVIPLVVCTVFVISLVESLLILPAHLAHSKPLQRSSRLRQWQQRFSAGFSSWVISRYQPLVERAVAHRYLSVSIGVAALSVVLAYAASGRMGFELMPTVESDVAEAVAVLPVGTPSDRVNAAARQIEAAAAAIVAEQGGDALSRGIFTRINENQIRVQIFLTDATVRPIGTSAVTDLWRRQTPAIADAQFVRFAADSGGPGGGPALTIELSHRDVAVLDQASSALAAVLTEYPNVADVDDGFQAGKNQFNLTVLDAGRSLGLSAREIATQVRSAFFGAEVLRQQRGRNEVRVLVRLPESERAEVSDVTRLLIRTPAGTYVPLDTVARIESGHAYDTISRRDGRRTVQVSANVTPRSEANQVLTSVQAEILPQLQRDFPGLSYSLEGRQADMREAIASLALGFVLALGLIYVLLAIPFASYVQPAIVMFAIPFGVFGAIIGHVLMGYSMSIISIMGIIALSGVVVNDSLVMVHYANQRRALGDSAFEAIVHSGARRFRPILLTTLSTFGGLAPMIFETSRQARFMIPMAISVGYGILFATAITLLLVPCLYMIVEDIRGRLGMGAQLFEAPEVRA
ncbi:efflux RND transporter permease subunit [Pseudomarimonas arenosa]|uniref:Efflux RND transporter permease subunit n=1 Tax=Pseudomarimonas arenosa TaxID=2774145 RepID=A0AAW3ZU60_9GAMM|nr:efflux RND transporter permease subunit [Pseudomarimonas arenosa]MBD8527872.1 efflux RND transporter permease subunit [Pseudomarimonas arenosa]